MATLSIDRVEDIFGNTEKNEPNKSAFLLYFHGYTF